MNEPQGENETKELNLPTDNNSIQDYQLNIEHSEPTSFQEAMNGPKFENWKKKCNL